METYPERPQPTTHTYKQYGNAIQLTEISNNNESSSEEDDVQFSRKQYKIVRTLPSEPTSLPELPSLYSNITLSDVLFNCIVLCVVCLNLFVDVTLVIYHYNDQDNWASGLTCLCLCFGGLALLGQFWNVTYDQIDRIYTRGKCTRIWVNSFPWFATVITSYQATQTCIASRSNPMQTQKHAKLQELLHSFLRIQGLAQCAPQAVLQLIVLLEELDTVSWMKATLLITSIATNLTIITTSNLPLKSTVTPSSYNPYTRLFIGLRMISSFSSRTLSLSILFSTSRCLLPSLLQSSTFISHVIPTSIILTPRLIFTIADYIATKLSVSRQRQNMRNATELENLTPIRKTRLADIFFSYVATIFIPFSDPPWVFWYVSIETVVFVVYGVIGEVINDCFGITISVSILLLFILTFGFVPCIVPAITQKVKQTRTLRT